MNLKIENIFAMYIQKKEKVLALQDVSFVVESGDFLSIVGPSGCGKTTLLKCISGLMSYAGKISIDDVDIEQIEIKNRNISYISQHNNLYPKMTVFDNIAYPLKLLKMPYDEINTTVNDVAKMLDIEFLLTRKPKQLSIGQQQKIAIAKAIARHADLYLFDEPLSALDEESKIELKIILKKLNEKLDATFIYVTHNFKEALALSNKIIVMNNGKIEQIGTPKEVFNNPVNDFVKSFFTLDDDNAAWEEIKNDV